MLRSIIFLFLGIPCFLFSQSRNYVPNYSFEEIYNLPIKPNPKNTFEYEPRSGFKPFQYNLKYWYAGSKTTPDLRISNSASFRECQKRYGNCDRARSGDFAVGIITSMTNSYTDSYREYIQVKLRKTLRPGVKTYVEVWVAKERQAKLVSNNIGIYFSQKKWQEDTEVVVRKDPQINADTLINAGGQKWVKIEGSFVPDEPLRYLTIGNFFDNQHTLTERYKYYNASPYVPPYAYYLIDDIKVWQDQPATPDSTQNLAFGLESLEANQTIQLKNIHFEFDSSHLQASSYVELNKLLSFLESYPQIRIAIHGHTDHYGNNTYNDRLSRERAKAVYDFLIAKGIAPHRLHFEGFGESRPMSSGESEEARSQNRRVEFIILPEEGEPSVQR